MATHSLTVEQGWVQIASGAGRWQVDLGSQGPVWLSGVVSSAPPADDFSTFVLEQNGDKVLEFPMEGGEKLYAKVDRSQTIAVTAMSADPDIMMVSAQVTQLAARIGTNSDNAGDPTVFGYLKQIDANTTP